METKKCAVTMVEAMCALLKDTTSIQNKIILCNECLGILEEMGFKSRRTDYPSDDTSLFQAIEALANYGRTEYLGYLQCIPNQLYAYRRELEHKYHSFGDRGPMGIFDDYTGPEKE